MPHSDSDWKVMYYSHPEPTEPRTILPLPQESSWLKIMVPVSDVASHTEIETGQDGERLTVFQQGGVHVICDINVLNELSENPTWTHVAQYEAFWDEMPAVNGYFTFYAPQATTDTLVAVPHLSYYHHMTFHSGFTATGNDTWCDTSAFLV